jgi:hypothetical protein
MTCLTLTGQSKVNIHGVGELRLEAQDARLKAKEQKERFRAEKQEAQQRKIARNNSITNAYLQLHSTTGGQLRASGEETKSTVTFYPDGKPQNKTVYTHTGDVTQTEQFSWNGEEWENFYKSEYKYENGLLILEAFYNGEGNKWLPYSKREYKYDYIAWRTTLEAYYTGKGEEWIPVEKHEYTYNGNLEEHAYYKEGMPYYKYIDGYDANGNQILHEYYDGKGNDWVGSNKTTHSYDNHIHIKTTDYEWKDTNWAILQESTYDYDEGQTIDRDKVYVTTFCTTSNREGAFITYKVGLNIPPNGQTDYSSDEYYFAWVLASQKEVEFKNELTYDNDNLTKVDVYSVTEENGEKVESFLYDYVIGYDSDNRMVSIISSAADGSTGKYIRQYNTNGQITLQEEQDCWRHVWTYTDNSFGVNQIVSHEYYYSDLNGWHNSDKSVYTYDPSSRKTLEILEYRGDKSGSGWVNNSKQEYAYAYNVNGSQALSAYSVWDTSSSEWVLNEKEVIEYDDKGRVINTENLKRSDDILRGSKQEYEYDTEGEYLSEAYYLWGAEGDTWWGSYKIVNNEKNDDGDPVFAIYYRWNVNKWERSGNTLYYPDADQEQPIVLARTIFEVAEAFSHKYTFDLRSLLPDLTGFGKLTYKLGEIKNDDGILDDIDDMKIEGTFLIISIKAAITTQSAMLRAGTLSGKLASIPVTITSENYGDFLATIEVKTSAKKRVNIVATMEGGIYNGEPFAYTGTSAITEESETEDVVNDLTLDILYETETGTLSETVPVNAGDYKLILSVPADNEDYVGDLSINFTIEQRPIQIVAEDKTAQVGSALPEFTYKIIGGVADETAITGTPILSSTANMSVAGSYTIALDLKNVTPTGNYKFADNAAVTGTLTVTGDDTPPATSTPVSGVSLNSSDVELAVNGTFQLIASVSPAGADNQGVSWTTSDAAIATVANGVVMAIAPGTATITVTTDDGGYTAICTVVVTGSSVVTEQVLQEVIAVFFYESTLTVNSPTNETITVYNFNGRLLFTGEKPQGKAVFTVGNPAGGKIAIVKGSSGWTKKIIR